uniref:Tetraspanin-33 n=1 Tax=Magallana gigas TaxID=29159 RepID=K1PUU2_MAGGI
MAPGRRRDRSSVNPCLKYFIFLFNFVFLLIGVATVGLTSWIIHEKDKKITSFIDVVLDPSLLLLIAGCIATLISFLGAIGALREHQSMLTAYSHLVTLFIFIQVIGVVFVFLFYYDKSIFISLKIYPDDLFKDAIVRYRDDPDQQDFIDGWQKEMDCCGFSDDDEGYKAWNNNIYYNCTDENKSAEKCAVPWSCCVLKDSTSQQKGNAERTLTESAYRELNSFITRCHVCYSCSVCWNEEVKEDEEEECLVQPFNPLNNSNNSDTFVDLSKDESPWKVCKGSFLQVGLFCIPARCEFAPQGLSKFSHLNDGCMELVLFDFPFVDVIRVKEVKFRPRIPMGWKHTDRKFHEIQYRMSKLEKQASRGSQVLELDDEDEDDRDNDSVVKSPLDEMSDFDSEDEDDDNSKDSKAGDSRKVCIHLSAGL